MSLAAAIRRVASLKPAVVAGVLGAVALLYAGVSIVSSSPRDVGDRAVVVNALLEVASRDTANGSASDAAASIRSVALKATSRAYPSSTSMAYTRLGRPFAAGGPDHGPLVGTGEFVPAALSRGTEGGIGERARARVLTLRDVDRIASSAVDGAADARRVRERLVLVVTASLVDDLGTYPRRRDGTALVSLTEADGGSVEATRMPTDLATIDVADVTLRGVLGVLLQDVEGRRLSSVAAMARAGTARTADLGRVDSTDVTGSLRR